MAYFLPPPLDSTEPISGNYWKYHVYFNYNRTENAGNNFVDHLHYALTEKGIHAFKDDQEAERGRNAPPESLEAIAKSRFSIVVLSRDYACSTWCLDELVRIMECFRSQVGLKVVPVYYDADPSEVSNVTGRFGEALASHVEQFGEESVQKWREALVEVANLSGWDLRGRNETTSIKHIVRCVSEWLTNASSGYAGYLCGVDSNVKELHQLLYLESNDVLVVGLWGPGGIGKTTIAKIMLERISGHFDACCFLENVEEKFKNHGLVSLGEELLSERNSDLWSVRHFSCATKDACQHRKVLLVVDDVDSLEQLAFLGKGHKWFGPGSRIIITTRDKNLLLAHGVHALYEVKHLENDAALQLFSWHAFKQSQPASEFLELSKHFVSYANGLPLALEVLGSHLYHRRLSEWENFLYELRGTPFSGLKKLLKISFNGLSSHEREVFLDIACFFNGERKDVASNVLHAYGGHPDVSLQVLMDMALLAISNNRLSMHKLIRDMGREFVKQESISEPGQCRRLWDPDEIIHVLETEMGTMQVETISLDMSKIGKMSLASRVFTKMRKLRLLKFYNSQVLEFSSKVLLPEGLQFLPSKLSYLRWDGYPLESLPLDFSAENLVALHLPYSKIKELWRGRQHVPNLRLIDLSHSDLIRFPELTEANKLETLYLEDCKDLVDVSSIENLQNLLHLDLSDCYSLQELRSTTGCTSLKTFDLSGCINLEVLPELPRSLEYLYLSGTAIRELPPSITHLPSLVELDLSGCRWLQHIPDLSNLVSLENLNVTGCPNISTNELQTAVCDGVLQEEPVSFYIKNLEQDHTEINEHSNLLVNDITIPANKHMENIEWLLLSTSLVLEGTSATFEQLQYALLGMVMAILGLMLCMVELTYKARKEQATMEWRTGSLPWIYSHYPRHKLFGTTIEYFGLVAAIWQLSHSTVGYIYARHKSQNPLKMTVAMFLFCLCQLVGKLVTKYSRVAPRPESHP